MRGTGTVSRHDRAATSAAVPSGDTPRVGLQLRRCGSEAAPAAPGHGLPLWSSWHSVARGQGLLSALWARVPSSRSSRDGDVRAYSPAAVKRITLGIPIRLAGATRCVGGGQAQRPPALPPGGRIRPLQASPPDRGGVRGGGRNRGGPVSAPRPHAGGVSPHRVKPRQNPSRTPCQYKDKSAAGPEGRAVTSRGIPLQLEGVATR